ncbi:hypothetical protein MMC15_001031 [Xylographa vitiligo]|nr:hypothetical protein [Xylographa vitiligo]
MAARRFNIAAYGPGFILDTNDYDGCEDPNLTHVPCPSLDQFGRQSIYCDRIFVAIDGACRNNGTPHAQSAIGVYFGMYSKYNISKIFPDDQATNQIAELRACLTALQRIIAIKMGNTNVTGGLHHPLAQAVIKADSQYVVKGMTDWILTWRNNGYTGSDGRPVKNAWYFQKVDDCINRLEDLGVNVRFWHVLRNSNKEADHLANAALDAASV